MKVELLSTEVIKPHTSTPPNLRNYSISLLDELSPSMNVPAILYYPADIPSSGKENATINSRCKHLKLSLSKALTKFYPFAGRYIEESYMVDCSDQGAEFVEAKVDVRLDHLLGQGKNLKVELLNLLLPRPLGAADEVTDPLLAVQVSEFACGGYTIAVLTSHRIADMSTTSTFISEWATDAKQQLEGFNENHFPMSPNWNSALLFPGKKLSGVCLGLTRPKENVEDHKIVTKMFFFNKSAISRIREKARPDNSSEKLPTRVQSVFGIIGKAMIDIHAANPRNHRGFLLVESVNMRGKTDPPISMNQCGNLYLGATVQSAAGEKGVEFQNIVDLLTLSVKREMEKCKMILSLGNEGQMMVSHGYNELTKTLSNPEISSVCMFSDWCKFPIYNADFGWGKPIWVSSVNVPIRNIVYLLGDKSGEGIEAWVNMNVDDMPKFEQDSNIMEFTT